MTATPSPIPAGPPSHVPDVPEPLLAVITAAVVTALHTPVRITGVWSAGPADADPGPWLRAARNRGREGRPTPGVRPRYRRSRDDHP